MASYNKVILIGNLTRDVDLRYTPKGSAVADLAVAVNRTHTADNGEKREEVTYVDVVLWSKLAELAGQYLKKGRSVFIEGRLQMESWEDKQTGQKRTKIKVVGEVMQFLDSKGEGDGDGERRGGGGSGNTSQRPVYRQPTQGDRPRNAQSRTEVPPPVKEGEGWDEEEESIPF